MTILVLRTSHSLVLVGPNTLARQVRMDGQVLARLTIHPATTPWVIFVNYSKARAYLYKYLYFVTLDWRGEERGLILVPVEWAGQKSNVLTGISRARILVVS